MKKLHGRILLGADQAERRVEQELQIVGQEARMLAERACVSNEAREVAPHLTSACLACIRALLERKLSIRMVLTAE